MTDTIEESMKEILQVYNLKKYFPGVKAVDDISFSIKTGTCFGLLGPNGAGKTTTIEIIEGILKKDSGDILYKESSRGGRFREEVGIQLQSTELPQFLTVRETLQTFMKLYGRTAIMQHIIDICRLEDIIDRDNRKISGGQKQRLLLAMALANDPELIFLDEPTTGLDPQARRYLWDIVDKIKSENKTVVLTTHYMEEAQILCDEIAIMDHGKIIVQGTPEALLKEHCQGASILIRSEPDTRILDDLPCTWFRVQEGIELQTNELNHCIRLLSEKGIDLSTMTVRSPNLEDLFLLLTGRELRT